MMAEVLHHGVPLSGQPLDGERLSGHCRLARAGELDHHVRVAGVGRQRSPHRVEGGAVHGGAVQQQQRHALTFDRVTDELSVERKRGHVAKVAAATGWPRGGRYGLSAAAKNSVMCTAALHLVGGQRIAVEQPAQERCVAEVAEQRAVAGDEQVLWILPAEHTGVHLALEEHDRSVEHRAQHCRQVDAEVGAAVECLAAHQAHVVGVVGEQVEARFDDQFHLALTGLGRADGRRESVDPVAEQLLEDFAVQGFFRREVVQQAGATDAHAGGDVVERRAVVAVLGEAAARLGQDELTG